MNMKLWNCGNMKLWKYENDRMLTTLVVCILAYLHTSTFAYSASLDAAVWRGETAYVAIPETLQDKAAGLAGMDTGKDVSLTLLKFDEVKSDFISMIKKSEVVDHRGVPDICREWKTGDAAKPTMVKISASPKAKPGVHTFGPLTLTVIDRVLPPAKDWKYFLDIWQHPWAVSRFFGVEPFSKEHFAKMEPIYRALAECGCKALTVTLLDLPWNHQCYDGYGTMVGRVKNADGTWSFDYTIFDEYVEFGRRCGVGPDIACYSMCPWRYRVTWKDAEGKDHREKMLPGTPEFEDYWGPFLVDFARHLKEKGWFEDTYIAMDERGPDDVRKIVTFIQSKAPGLKVSACGKTKPSAFDGVQIENFCLGLVHLRSNFLPELQPRREKGFKTTFYVCGSARTPNTFMFSNLDEGYWLGAYPVMIGFDGFLRWAANSWPKNPYEDASYKTKQTWVPGDVYLIYPKGELSARLIALRAGVVAAEKMRILKELGTVNGVRADEAIKRLAAPYGFRSAVRGFGKDDPPNVDFAEFRCRVEEFVNNTPATFSAVSPDGCNELRLGIVGNGMEYSIWRGGKAIVEPTRISLTVEGRGVLNGTGAEPKATTRKVEGTLETPLYKKSSIDLAANETRIDFGDWAVVLHARNDGVAWRFETEFEGVATVTAENTSVTFPKGTELCYTVASGFMSGWEKPAQIGPVESVPFGHPQIVMTPFTATVPGVGVVCVTESNLLHYPGLNFYRRENETDILRSWQAGVPWETERKGRRIRVNKRRAYLARTSGRRVYPWRVFVLGDTPSDLVAADIVYALAEPSRLDDSSWVKPGQVAWDWWNGFQITDVPGLDTGCNYETYKAYIDFAAANGIPYIIMDEGWSERLNLDKPRDVVNVEGVINYGREKGVGVILWAAWSMLANSEDRERVFDRYAAMGAKGFKIDFMERDDQNLETFLEKTAAEAAKRHLVVLFHGIHKPTGLQRTYPNILNYEGVYGLEQGGSIGGRKVVISNDVNLVYTRMVAGFMDYTPGAMRNRAFDAPPYDKEKDVRACYGTRCHQLALFPMFEAPIQMLCDSPTQYRTEPECTAFITKVPTVWDETVGITGEIGKFASVARRKDGEWWLGAITNWDARELEIPTAFLGSGEWKVEAFEDAPDADKNAEHYVRRVFTLKAGEPLKIRLAPGGGFAARFALCPVTEKDEVKL